MEWLVAAWLALWLPRRIERVAGRLFPAARRPELLFLFGAAAVGFGAALWRSGADAIGLAVGWFLVAALSWAGYRIACILFRGSQ